MYRLYRNIILSFIAIVNFSFVNTLFSQENIANTDRNNVASEVNQIKTSTKTEMFLEKAHYDSYKNNLPYFLDKTILSNEGIPSFELTDVVTRELNEKELAEIEKYKKHINSNFSVSISSGISRNEKIAYAKIIPIRLNVQNKYEYLESYRPYWNYQNKFEKLKFSNKNQKTSNASSSVLATGKWYKIGVTENAVYKIDKSFLSTMGLDVKLIDPRKIKVYGNGGKLISEKNSDFKYDDLIENSIFVAGQSDGVFNDNDYILFYGQSTDDWKLNTNNGIPFHHYSHSFSDTSFYFLNFDLNALGKRVSNQNSLSNIANSNTSSYDYFDIHEVNAYNPIKSGRQFFGEKFDLTNSYSFPFPIPNAILNDSIYVKTRLLSRCDVNSSYLVSYDGVSYNVGCAATDIIYYLADVGYTGEFSKGSLLNSSNLNISVTKQTSSAIGWLDYIEINARRALIYNNSQFTFRDKRVIKGSGSYAKYSLTNQNASFPLVWNITDPLNPKNQLYNIVSNNFDFTSTSDSLNEFVIFNENNALLPTYKGIVPNQNLHGIAQADYIIVTHPMFLENAKRLAKLHFDHDNLTYAIATTTEVYNEFSSGTPDIGGIREFVKMLYFRPNDPTKATQYLLLLGDGSYKNKDINLFGNTALVPTYQTYVSTSYTDSFVTDDFFAMMDNNEGDLISGDIVDIGVGRFPVKTKEEADAVTSKIEQYYKLNYNFDVNAEQASCSSSDVGYPQGDWRNSVTFLADDEDSNEHFTQANALANKVYDNYKSYNVNKIFADSYVQYSSPGGDRYPDVVNEINKSMDRGCLIFNYTGHGGELGLGAERFVDVPQILAWKNINNMPLMVTATCEFSRFDDPDRTSAGEYCLLNSNGGAIGLMTTVRVAYSGPNYSLNNVFYNHALTPMSNGEMPHVGDLYRLTKRDIGFARLYMNFVILGDPALKLAYPKNLVYTASINSQTLTSSSVDTLKALKKLTITGYVADKTGNKLTNFNGVVFPTVYDKEVNLTTLKNDPGSNVANFNLQKNIIYKGKSAVINGDFTYSFLVPKDISYDFGKGKISYYAHNGINDASGYYDKVVIGGSETNVIADNKGPEIKLYLNDEKFVSGGTTNETPKIYALVLDSSGINTVGNGIGHDIVAVIDAQSNNPIILNDYYVANLNSYQSGKIRYNFNTLKEGNHQLSLKVWDVQNNSSIAYTDFVVAKEANLALSHILNFPNPFTTKTKFFIEHNQCCTNLKVLIQVYTISGKLVKSINQTINNQGFRYDGIDWDGKDDFGDKLARGVYIYRVSVTDGGNKKAEKIEKLVILN